MRFVRSHRAGATILAATLSALAAAATPEEIFRNASPSIWVVHAKGADGGVLASGSGVVVATGRVITNCHVLRGAVSITLRQEHKQVEGKLEFPDGERDLCQLTADRLPPPPLPVRIAPTSSLRVGQKVYAIGAPRGLEQSLSDGLVSALRRDSSGEIEFIQTSAPISPGSSGGGLFDEEGRLIGITSAGMSGTAQNLNFARPAQWISDVPSRGAQALAKYKQSAKPEPQAPAVATSAAASVPPSGSKASLGAPLQSGNVLEYVLTDRLTGKQTPVIYSVDRTTAESISFNRGTRIERATGEVDVVSSVAGGIFDASSPPGGWARPNMGVGAQWTLDYLPTAGERARHQLKAVVVGEDKVQVNGIDLAVVQIAYEGWRYAVYGVGMPFAPPATRFTATVWYSHEMHRVVRFQARYSVPPFSTTDETLELVSLTR